ICGIVLIAIGGVLLANENKGLESFTKFSVGGFAIGVGVIIFLIAAFGCFGALKGNSCLLTTYAVILIILFILQIVLGALSFVALQNDGGELDDKITKIVRETFTNESQDIIDDIQREASGIFECCGVSGSTYWTEEIGYTPNSCCENDDCVNNQPYQQGCITAFKDIISRYVLVIGIVVIVFGVIEVN
ncbi:Tetraspannin domain containing protein, partial [Asbolus verrucosus]